MNTPYTHPSMPRDEFPSHVTRSPFSPFLRPLPENVDLTPVSWSDSATMPITVTPKEPLQPYFEMVQLDTPSYFEQTFSASLAHYVEAHDREIESWLEGVIADPVGRQLVKNIIDRVEAKQKQQFAEALIEQMAKPLDVTFIPEAGCYVLGGEED